MVISTRAVSAVNMTGKITIRMATTSTRFRLFKLRRSMATKIGESKQTLNPYKNATLSILNRNTTEDNYTSNYHNVVISTRARFAVITIITNTIFHMTYQNIKAYRIYRLLSYIYTFTSYTYVVKPKVLANTTTTDNESPSHDRRNKPPINYKQTHALALKYEKIEMKRWFNPATVAALLYTYTYTPQDTICKADQRQMSSHNRMIRRRQVKKCDKESRFMFGQIKIPKTDIAKREIDTYIQKCPTLFSDLLENSSHRYLVSLDCDDYTTLRALRATKEKVRDRKKREI